MAKYKRVKVGAILEGKNGLFMVLGQPEATNPDYIRNVGLRVVDGQGKELAKIVNGILNLSDPRQNPKLSDAQKNKISSKLKYEVVISEKAED